MELRPIDIAGFDPEAVDGLARCENNVRFDGDRNPLLWVRRLVADLCAAGAWPGRHVLATPESGLVEEGMDLKVNVPGTDAYVSCFVDSLEDLLGETDPTWQALGDAVTDRLNHELRQVRDGLLARPAAQG